MKNHHHERNVTVTTMMGMLGGRLLTISTFLIFLSFMLARDGIAFYAFIAFSYIITIPYSLWMRNQDAMRRLAPLQFLADLVFVSGLVYFAGGHGQDILILLYPLIILSAGIILPLRQTIQITVLSIISYVLVILLMSQQILVEYPSTGNAAPLIATSGAMLLRISIFIFFGVASAYVSSRCDYINRKEKQFREVTQVIFKNVKTGLLLLDRDGTILMANDRACVLLGRDETELAEKNIDTIHLRPSDASHANMEFKEASDYFRRADGSIFPVNIEDVPISLPGEAVPGNRSPDSVVEMRILNFNDLSSFLRLQGQNRQLERIKAAANMAEEMARQIQPPLAGVSGAAHLLEINLKNDHADGSQECNHLCRQILLESGRMDKVVQHFLDYAEFSPADIRDLVQTNIEDKSGNKKDT